LGQGQIQLGGMALEIARIQARHIFEQEAKVAKGVHRFADNQDLLINE
jgi:hypothetical protein